jgi:hypothetical protein
MPNRAERRAAERAAQKLAVNAGKTMSAAVGGADQAPIPSVNTEAPSDARLAANRANAQHSTGPRTEEGKAKSSMNAVKTGLTGRTVLLPTDDVLAYERHVARLMADLSPATDTESHLVQNIADTEWRLLRIPQLEASIYAIGRLELADQFPAHASEPANRDALILGRIFLAYRKDLTNLALQERRLRNQRKDDLAELGAIQQARADELAQRARRRTAELLRIPQLKQECWRKGLAFDPATLGFDFSLAEYNHYEQRNEAHYEVFGACLDFDEVLTAYRASRKESKAA